jgi:hypothetical protein
MAFCMFGFSSDAQMQAALSTSSGITHLYFTRCDGNHQCQPWQNSSQNSVFLRGADCHCYVAEFLLNKCKKMIKSKFRASYTLLNSAEYAITRKESFSSLA